jgi:hypothetical protein
MNIIRQEVLNANIDGRKVFAEVLSPYTHPMMVPVTKTGSRTFERREPEREIKSGFQRASAEDVLAEYLSK